MTNEEALFSVRQDVAALFRLGKAIHALNAKWWHDPHTGNRIERNKGEMIALMHSELSEMLEGVRKSSMDDHLPKRKSEEVELADLLIRAFDYAHAHGLDLAGAVIDKCTYNISREDHKHENRIKPGGKAF